MKVTRLPVAIVLIFALGAAAIARGEVEQEGNLLVAFNGKVSPLVLPRSTEVPVTVSVDMAVKTSNGTDPPPQLREIAIGINRGGKLFARGLPTCKVREVQPTTMAAARQICGGAIVGSGHIRLRVHLADQDPFTFQGPLLAFNAKPVGGKRRILAQIYGTKPLSAFILNFKVYKRKGTFGTLIRTTLPKSARKWAYVTDFDMKLHRIYTYKGKRRSFISAACPAPPGFPGALYRFARGKFSFAGDRDVTTTLVRECRVAGLSRPG